MPALTLTADEKRLTMALDIALGMIGHRLHPWAKVTTREQPGFALASFCEKCGSYVFSESGVVQDTWIMEHYCPDTYKP